MNAGETDRELLTEIYRALGLVARAPVHAVPGGALVRLTAEGLLDL